MCILVPMPSLQSSPPSEAQGIGILYTAMPYEDGKKFSPDRIRYINKPSKNGASPVTREPAECLPSPRWPSGAPKTAPERGCCLFW